MRIDIDIKFGGIKKLKENIKKKFGSKVDATELVDDILREAGQRCLAKTQERTPVATGTLKSKWKLGDVRHRGFYNTITIENKEEYATYIEYGHRIPPATRKQIAYMVYNGIYDPTKPRRREDGWYEGKFMLTKSIDETKKELPEIAEELITKKVSDIFQ